MKIELVLGEFCSDAPLTAKERAAIQARNKAEKGRMMSTNWPQVIKEARALYDRAKPKDKDNYFAYLCTCIQQSLVR